MELPNYPTDLGILLAGASQGGSHFSPGCIDVELFCARGHDSETYLKPVRAFSFGCHCEERLLRDEAIS